MAVRPIVLYPDPVLFRPTQPVEQVDDEIRELVQDMAETLYAAPGIGLAANQIGVSKRVCIVDLTAGEQPDSLHAFINPVVVESDGPEVGEEGHHRWAATVSRHLVNLHDKLVLHFRHEENEGFFEAIVERAPSFSKRVDILVGEHGEMLGEIRELMGYTLRYSEGREPEDPQLRRRITGLLDTLSRHEVDETELMQRIEYRDIGVGD